MPDQNKVARLVQQTLEQTRSDKIDWKTTPDDKIFSAVIADGKYILKSFSHTDYENDEEIGPPSLALFSNDNQLLVDITYKDEFVSLDDLASIYQLARDNALGIGKAIDEVLDFLDDIPF